MIPEYDHRDQLAGQLETYAGKFRFPGRKEAAEEIGRLKAERGRLKETLAKAEKAHQAQAEAFAELGGHILQLRKQLEGAEQREPGTLSEQRDGLNQEIKKLADKQRQTHIRKATNESALKNILTKSSELESLEARLIWVRALSNTANGDLSGKEKIMLETYVQMAFFDRIIDRANTRFMIMSGGTV